MRKETKQAFKALLEAVKEDLNNTETPEICDLMPKVGTFMDYVWDCDDNDKWFRRPEKYDVTEEKALETAQDELLNGYQDDRLDEFFCEGRIRPLMVEFMRHVAKEALGC